MNFDEQLRRAIDRGQRRGERMMRQRRAAAMSEEELKRLHSQYRLRLSEHIEQCIRRLANHVPGFQCETIFGERGWGAACKRDDVRMAGRGQRQNYYSRLEMTVRPFSELHILELVAKGTVANREVFNRRHYEKIEDVDPERFIELIDTWVLEFAELFAANA